METPETKKHWTNGEGYNRYITAELGSFRKNAWKEQITAHFDRDRNLKILDIGTGPGFFSCILAEEGYDVTGIDFSEGMLKCARENAEKLHVSPTFLLMDVNDLQFEDETFDVIVTRNVTWTLEFPEKVYTELRRILKPGGMLLIYDANWHMHWFDEEKLKRVKERERRHLEKYGKEEIVSGGDMEYFARAPLTSTLRPDWDIKTLENLGFDVAVEEDIGRKVYEEWEKELYAESPIFEICAVKKEKSEAENNMHTYWQGRAETFGFSHSKERLSEIGERFQRYLPQEDIKILDVGTGTGIIAVSLAKLGYDVTGVDLCSNMIEKAKENAKALNLDIEFYCTSAGDLPFADSSFDVIVNRNLTWALPDPEETFLQWKRVLKPGGILMYQDANQYYYYHNAEDFENRELYAKIRGGYHRSGGDGDFDPTLCDETAKDLPMAKVNRPYEWDDIALPQMGFDIVAEEIEKPQNKLKYGIAEGFANRFLIVAINNKPEEGGV